MSPFHIIPAIDLLDGKVVRLYQGDYAKVSIYNHDPCQQAQDFLTAGAQFLHIVDLNAARSGRSSPENRTAISAIAKAVGNDMALELGGGIRSDESLVKYFALGIKRCIIGTAAIKDPEFLERALKRYGAEKILVGVDIYKGRPRVSGWEEASPLKTSDLLQKLTEMGLRKIIFTDISRDGTLEGPGDILETYLKSSKLDFILSGGLSSLKDLEAILAKRHPRLIGAISGRALYEKKLDLRAALEMCRCGEDSDR